VEHFKSRNKERITPDDLQSTTLMVFFLTEDKRQINQQRN